MSLLFETLLVESGNIPLLDYHNQRCQRSRLALFDLEDKIDLSMHIHVPSIYQNHRVRCRIDYDTQVRTIRYQLHHPREIRSLKMVQSEQIDYAHKYADRQKLSALYAERGDCDEVLIVVDGKFTDSYYYNLAFKKGEVWLTPNENLLPGTRRQFLLDGGVIQPGTILADDLEQFDQICLFNALTSFGSVVLDVADIVV